LSTPKSQSARKVGRPPKEPPKGSLGWRIREARKLAELEPDEAGLLVGLTEKMISYGEHHSNFSTSALFLLAQELKSDFDEQSIREYLAEWLVRMQRNWHLVPMSGHVELLERLSIHTKFSPPILHEKKLPKTAQGEIRQEGELTVVIKIPAVIEFINKVAEETGESVSYVGETFLLRGIAAANRSKSRKRKETA
jgi:hypothetical protein